MFIKRFLKKYIFDNYDDYKENAIVDVPENFNFAYDVVDAIASENPDKVAILWTNDSGDKKTITFKMLSDMSNRLQILCVGVALDVEIRFCCFCAVDGNIGC